MHTTEAEIKAGYRWFFGAGVFAIILACGLYCADQRLSESKREEVLGNTLYDLRTAQSSLGTGSIDERR